MKLKVITISILALFFLPIVGYSEQNIKRSPLGLSIERFVDKNIETRDEHIKLLQKLDNTQAENNGYNLFATAQDVVYLAMNVYDLININDLLHFKDQEPEVKTYIIERINLLSEEIKACIKDIDDQMPLLKNANNVYYAKELKKSVQVLVNTIKMNLIGEVLGDYYKKRKE